MTNTVMEKGKKTRSTRKGKVTSGKHKQMKKKSR